VSRLVLDRRRPPRSDQRRTDLLAALDTLLRNGTLEEITVADIADAVGMTRSAFYFYFENKGSAVAALSAQMYDAAAASANDLFAMTGSPRARIEAQMRGLVATWEQNQHLYRAMLDAKQTNPEVRAMWDIGRESFIDPVVAMIDAERAAGIAPPGPDSAALAVLLLELNDRAIESIARGHDLPLELRIQAMITIWLRTIYGTDDA
jgi:AcrR family transcriptional regulator